MGRVWPWRGQTPGSLPPNFPTFAIPPLAPHLTPRTPRPGYPAPEAPHPAAAGQQHPPSPPRMDKITHAAPSSLCPWAAASHPPAPPPACAALPFPPAPVPSCSVAWEGWRHRPDRARPRSGRIPPPLHPRCSVHPTREKPPRQPPTPHTPQGQATSCRIRPERVPTHPRRRGGVYACVGGGVYSPRRPTPYPLPTHDSGGTVGFPPTSGDPPGPTLQRDRAAPGCGGHPPRQAPAAPSHLLHPSARTGSDWSGRKPTRVGRRQRRFRPPNTEKHPRDPPPPSPPHSSPPTPRPRHPTDSPAQSPRRPAGGDAPTAGHGVGGRKGVAKRSRS